ncbi:hypothetical protein BG004_002978 [Podila humilis]|nr:hypothetical protein BG004_002978 [Podila humilis]
MWRRGPEGPSTLCNACGVKWKHGKILKDTPDSSTTTASASSASTKPTVSSLASSGTTSAPNASSKMNAPVLKQENVKPKGVKKVSTNGRHNAQTSERTIADEREVPPAKNVSKSHLGKRLHGVNDAERIVPVKKRHSSKVSSSILTYTIFIEVMTTPATTTNSNGPKMVSIHELESLHPTKATGSRHLVKKPSLEQLHGSEKIMSRDHEPTMTRLHQQPQPNQSSSHHHSNRSQGSLAGSSTKQLSLENVDMMSTKEFDTSASKTPGKPFVSINNHDNDHDNDNDNGKDKKTSATRSLYTNNTAAFPLPFPTISIAFGPNNAQYTYPNCSVVLYENHFRIKLTQGKEKTEIDVWKEGIEGTEFKEVGDGNSDSDAGGENNTIVMKALLRQYLTRFDKELLNPDRKECLIVFKFRERLDGGGPKVKPLLEHWLTTDIPVPAPV